MTTGQGDQAQQTRSGPRASGAAARGAGARVAATRGAGTHGAGTPGSDPAGLLAAARSNVQRIWPVAAVVLAALLWWPSGFWGLENWLHLPLRLEDAVVLLLSAMAAGAVAAALATSPWPRLTIVVAFSGMGWVLSRPDTSAVGDELWVLAGVLAVAGLLGLAIGSRAARGPLALATVLAWVAALSQATWPRGLALAVALALPFLVATRDRVAPTLLSVGRILLTWLMVSVLALALRHGGDALGPRLRGGSNEAALREVGQAAWYFLRTQWQEASSGLLQSHTTWFWVALSLAIVLVTARALLRTATVRREAQGRADAFTNGARRR